MDIVTNLEDLKPIFGADSKLIVMPKVSGYRMSGLSGLDLSGTGVVQTDRDISDIFFIFYF